MNKLIAEELADNLDNVEKYEVEFNEFDEGELRIYMDGTVPEDTLRQIEGDIVSQGVVLTEPVVQDANIVFIRFRKELAPLAIIAIIAGGVVVLVGSILGWQIFRTIQMGVPVWVWFIGGAAILYLILSTETAKRAGGYAIETGRAYVTRKAG